MASNGAPGPSSSTPSASTCPAAPTAPGSLPRRRGTRGLSRRRALALPPAIAALVALGGCGVFGGSARAQAYDTDAVHREISLEDAPVAAEAAAACAALSESLLRFRLGENPAANALTCPVGTALTIALLYAGSDAPADGVEELLGVASSADGSGAAADDARDQTWSALQNSLLIYEPTEAQLENFNPKAIPEIPLLHIANRVLLVGDNPAVDQAYLDAARQWYAATTEHAALSDAKATLDAWAQRHTGGLIKSSGIEITEDTRLVLQNALLFAAGWAWPFDANDTADEDFTLSDGTVVTARLMRDKLRLPYAQGQGWQAVRLQYAEGSGRTVMDVFLPEVGTNPSDLPEGTWAEASAALDANAYGQQRMAEVRLALPTFDLAPGPVNLLAFLTAQGITLDSLEHIGENLEVDQAVQQVRLMVKEEGTVAGALTEVSITESAVPDEEDNPVSFIVDHPFVVRILDQLTGLVLIEGVIMDPTATTG
ncbi:serpin family protein [Actinomyces sp. 565]|uniref:serpin family protein n=1 Tax=Actinomyces sp. 565 TaxID=2057794 RepID=UPI0013A6FDE9|nr:serpin family protein [Actinomyces sp. 565]NDR53402.1 serpin family protein [Actinomyces sp. 565]